MQDVYLTFLIYHIDKICENYNRSKICRKTDGIQDAITAKNVQFRTYF